MEEINQSDCLSQNEDMGDRFKFKCKYCFRELSSRQNLREHLYIHTGEKPYFCTEPGCGQKFRQGSLLSIHKKIHFEVRKSKKNTQIDRKCSFPRLTQLINMDFKFAQDLSSLDQEHMKSQIGEEDFSFIKHFIK
jgi:uncharacterized Zn-finger protein